MHRSHMHRSHTHTHTHTHTHAHTCTVFPRLLELNRTEIFTVNSVNVFLEWKEEAGVTYTANASPSASLMFIGNAGLQLTLLHNIVYNVNITATLCGPNSINTILNLSYGEFFIQSHCINIVMYIMYG